MTYLTESRVRARASQSELQKAEWADLALAIEGARDSFRDSFDIFLSHSIRDGAFVLGIKRLLEDAGKTVYVDWIADPTLNRENINGETAETLRKRMRQCTSLLYAYSVHSQRSRWMPWELGYFDGHNGNVAILPILPDAGELDFEGEEYLQVYPKADLVEAIGKPAIYINKSRRTESSAYKSFDDWRKGTDKLRPTA